MKLILTALLVFVTAIAAAAAEIPKGAHLLLRMQNTINTKSAQEGDYVYLRTATPLAANGAIVVPVGTYVQGVVAHVKRPGMVRGKGELGIRLETFTLPDGRVIRIIGGRVDSVDGAANGQKTDEEGVVEAPSSKLGDAGRIAVLAGQGAIVGTFVSGIGGVGGRTAGNIARGAGIGGGIGAAAGTAAVLLTRGTDVTLAQNTSVDIVFDQTVTIE